MTWLPADAIEITNRWMPETPDRDDHHNPPNEHDGWSEQELNMQADGAAADDWAGRETT